MPALASEIERTAADATVDYEVVGENMFDSSEPQDGFVDEVDGRASLSVFAPALSQGDFLPINKGQRLTLELAFDEAAQAANPSKGWMIVALDDLNGSPQADLLPAPQPES
jgi:hypothetical protein